MDNFYPLDCWILKRTKLFYLKLHVMQAQTWHDPSQNLIRISQAAAICKILLVETTLAKKTYGRLLENPKTEGPSKLFLPENNFKTCYTVSFLEKHSDFGDLDMKFRPIFFHMPLHLYELNIIQKISRKRLKNLRFTIFWSLFFLKC